MKRAVVGLCLVGVVAWSVTSGVRAQQALVSSAVPCASLAGMTMPPASIGLPTTGATLSGAELVAAAPQTVTGDRVVLAIPEYCKVTGSIAPVDPAAPKINFQVNLPTAWNRKIAQMGGSGNNGVIPVALTTGMQ